MKRPTHTPAPESETVSAHALANAWALESDRIARAVGAEEFSAAWDAPTLWDVRGVLA